MKNKCLGELVTLFGGSGPNEGDVHVDGMPVGHWNWDTKDAWVLCKQLGWEGVNEVKHSSFFGSKPSCYRIGYLDCNGREASILECKHQKQICYGYSQYKRYTAGVICSAEPKGIIT